MDEQDPFASYGEPLHSIFTTLQSLFDLRLIIESMPRLIAGLGLTVELVAISLAVGLAIAVPVALMRLSKNPLLSAPAYGFIFFFRGSPLLVQIFLIYYGLGQFDAIKDTFLWSFLRQAYWCALLAFSLNTAAYTAEILRGAIQGIPHGEIEAARACGMSGFLLFRRIVMPRAFRLMLPAYSNEVVLMLQASSLASIVTLADLTGVARVIIARSFGIFELFITIGIMYLALTYLIVWVFRAVEYRLSGHLRERPDTSPAKAAAMPAGLR